MPLIATLEGLGEVPSDLCAHGRPVEFCTLCKRVGRRTAPRGLASLPPAPPPPATPTPRPMTSHEKWSIAIGLTGLVLSIATTLALLHRTRR